ncbi:hypothetical protein M3Y97_00115600 [Aphelenchoides bicaudatus]|nr:hypothetical protein M3Y97_00115600 [Aphelenchoides bicaudatus]
MKGASAGTSSSYTDNLIKVIEIKLNNEVFYATISTGAKFSFCSKNVVRKLKLTETKINGICTRDSYGGKHEFGSYAKFSVKIGVMSFDSNLMINSGKMNVDMIIGMDVVERIWKKYGSVMNIAEDHMQFGSLRIPLMVKQLSDFNIDE